MKTITLILGAVTILIALSACNPFDPNSPLRKLNDRLEQNLNQNGSGANFGLNTYFLSRQINRWR